MVSYIGGLSKNHNKKTFPELQVFFIKWQKIGCLANWGCIFKWAHFSTAFDETVFIGNFVQAMQLLNTSEDLSGDCFLLSARFFTSRWNQLCFQAL